MEQASTTPSSDRDRALGADAHDVVTALLSFLCLAESSDFSTENRAKFAAAASRQAKILRDLFKGRLLLIVARDQPQQRERLQRAFAGDPEVEVVVDRRQGDRRRGGADRSAERRQADRRFHEIEQDLRRLGVALARPASHVMFRGRHQEETPSPSETSPDHRVLIIDDDPAVVQLLRTFFEADKGGYAVETALNGEKGLAVLEAERPDVVLLDVRMPGLDGLEVLKRIRAVDHSIPVIMVSAATHAESSEALQNGAFAYIPKPFDLRYIENLVAVALESRTRS